MGSFSGGQSLAEQVPERLGYCCLSREKDTVTMPRQYQCHISGLIIMWDRFKAPRVRVGEEAVAAQAGIGGEQLLPHTPDRNPKKRVMDTSHTIFATSSCEHPGDTRSRGGWVCMTPPPSRSLQGVFR
jgi:hypothetical protein